MMNEIISAHVYIADKLTMRQIMSLYQASKQHNGNVYLHCSQRTVDAKKLSMLVSFMLTISENSSIKIIVEGQEVHKKLQELRNMFSVSDSEQTLPQKYFLNPTDTIQV